MGTKNNPGTYDCYANAEPDEPIFVLLGRDPRAPALVNDWADMSARRGTGQDKIDEARACATAMIKFRIDREAKKSGIIGLEEFAQLAEAAIDTVQQWRLSDDFPKPLTNLACGPVFSYDTAVAYISTRLMKVGAKSVVKRGAK